MNNWQRSNPLYPGVDGEKLKEFALKVKCYTVEEALINFEKEIHRLKLASSHFQQEPNTSKSVIATYSIIQ